MYYSLNLVLLSKLDVLIPLLNSLENSFASLYSIVYHVIVRLLFSTISQKLNSSWSEMGQPLLRAIRNFAAFWTTCVFDQMGNKFLASSSSDFIFCRF